MWVVDPGLAEPVLDYIKQQQLQLKGILITHTHNDHIGGLAELLTGLSQLGANSCPVYGPAHAKLANIHVLNEGDSLSLFDGIDATVMHLPGHLPEHLAFYIEPCARRAPALFCGDIIFASGCGRMFSGPAATFKQSLERIAAMPGDTELYCAHEYSLINLDWALSILPEDAALNARKAELEQRFANKGCTLPSDVAAENRANLFLRCAEKTLWQAVADKLQRPIESSLACFAGLRELKDNY